MDRHVSIDSNNPINWTDELILCAVCQCELEETYYGELECFNCLNCNVCEEYKEECQCLARVLGTKLHQSE